MTEIKPCKVCGGPGLQGFSFSKYPGGKDEHSILCFDCEVYGPVADTLEAAIKAWNDMQAQP